MTAELFPTAWQHLDSANQLRKQIGSRWAGILDEAAPEDQVTTDPSGCGTISTRFLWPSGQQSALTDEFKALVDELWSALDSLVRESFMSLSVLRHPRHPEKPRFFPVADSRESFEAFLAESCLDGILDPQYRMVRDVQPFTPDSGNDRADVFRRTIRQLLTWETALVRGEQMGAWTTPVEAQVLVDPPLRVTRVTMRPAGALEQSRTQATFEIANYVPGMHVEGMSGAYVDICFTAGFDPSDPDDTFDRRVGKVIHSLQRFALLFGFFSSQIAGSRQVLLGEREPHNPWADATASPRGWSEEDLAALCTSETGFGIVEDPSTITLIVSTPDGTFERVIPNATPLRPYDRTGTAAEIAIKDAAATWGLPDFVFSPVVERKGAGVREVGDGLLIVGGMGAIIQAKAREGIVGEPDRERSWLTKQIARGTSQAGGTARRLRDGLTVMVNGRGRSVPVDGSVIDWVGVVVIEHSGPPDDVIPELDGSTIPMVALLRRDWEFLFEQLRSTHAVVSYLHRVANDPQRLGTEAERYYELAAADAKAPPGPIDSSLQGMGTIRCVPTLPTTPAGLDGDEAHGLVRFILEDIATSPLEEQEHLPARQDALASLDSLPVAHRTQLGRFLLNVFAKLHDAEPDTAIWEFRTYLAGTTTDQLAFGVCSEYNDTIRFAFQAWLRLRHHERGERVGRYDGLKSIGVLLTPRADGIRRWDTTMIMIEGDPELNDAELCQFRELWNSDLNLREAPKD